MSRITPASLFTVGAFALCLLLRHLKRSKRKIRPARRRNPVLPPQAYTPKDQGAETQKIWLEEVKRFGIQVDNIANYPGHACLFVRYGDTQLVFNRGHRLLPRLNALALKICDSKIMSYYLLKHFGFPVPDTIVLATPTSRHEEERALELGNMVTGASAEELIEKALPVIKKRFGFPDKCVVVKPNGEFGGKGVLANLGFGSKERTGQDMDAILTHALRECFKEAQKDPLVLVQEHVYGRNYRVLALDYHVIAVSERMLPAVVGDGESTIQALIDKFNHLRGGHKPLTVNEDLYHILKTQALTLESIPKKGQFIELHSTHSITVGATTRDWTEEIHPSFVKMIQDLVKTLDIFVCGLDLHCEDITHPLEGQKCAILELNSGPGWYLHHTPVAGYPRNIGRAVLGAMFPELRKHPLYYADGGPAPGRMSRELCAQYLRALDKKKDNHRSE